MNSITKSLLALMLVTGLTACKKDEIKDDIDSAPIVDSSTAPDVTTAAVDPRNHTDVRNLDNPESLLSKRVIYFDYDQSTVRAEFRPVVQAHAAFVAANSSASVTLEGHADERGSREYNLALGERRGNSVSGLFSAQGVRGSQMNVVSYGEERPICRETSDSCWGSNRRVEIVYTAR
ncbi:MAG: peptidoglycan-associated lipoprotein Pal [Xanthomonadales bacterium]|nr:peptidoglycan-associated lipoprotein Pal [Xanthomonadales bacterium]